MYQSWMNFWFGLLGAVLGAVVTKYFLLRGRK
jgi:hypothetical protein